jgi:hypothetical protein
MGVYKEAAERFNRTGTAPRPFPDETTKESLLPARCLWGMEAEDSAAGLVGWVPLIAQVEAIVEGLNRRRLAQADGTNRRWVK